MINRIFHYSRSVFTTFAFVLIAGGIAYITIAREAEPDVQIPIIYVSLHHEGIAPEDSERLLVKVMENKLASITGVQKMTSVAFDDGGYVLLKFDAGFNPSRALADVRAQVDQAKSDLPSDADDPIVKEVNVSLFPILVVTLSGAVPEHMMMSIAEDLAQRIQELPQILKASITGKREEEVRIIVDPVKIQAYGLTSTDVLSQIGRNNALIAAGTLDSGQGRFAIKLPGLVETIEDLRQFPVQTDNDAVITVGDIGHIEKGFKDPTSFARLNGRKAIAIEISKRVGENIIESIAKVQQVVADQRATWPPWVEVSYSQDRSRTVSSMFNELQNSVIFAILLVTIVIIWSIGLRGGFLVAVAIPGSFLTGVLILSLLGLTINIVVLFALILTVGMLVDGVIVIVEYADRRLDIGDTPYQAYGAAAKRMTAPVIVSTLTTLVAFMPLLFWPDTVGQFMQYMPITLIAVLSASLVMALVVVPTFGAHLKSPPQHNTRRQLSLVGESGRFDKLTGIAAAYVKILSFCLRQPLKILVTTVAFLILIVVVYANFGRGIIFFPSVDPDVAIMQIHARGNLSIWEKDAIIRQAEKAALNNAEIATVYSRTAGQGETRDSAPDVIGSILLEFAPWQKRRPTGIILSEIKNKLSTIPGIKVSLEEKKAGPPVGKAIQVEVSSDDHDLIDDTVRRIASHLRLSDDYTNLEDGLPIPGIEWQFKVNRAEAARYGADVTLIGNALRLTTRGLKITDYRPDGSYDEVDIVVRFPPDYRTIEELDRIYVQTPKGSVPVTNFITREARPKTSQLRRSARKRAITIKADVRNGILADDKVKELSAWINAQDFDHSRVNIDFKGEDEEQKKAANFLKKAFLTALFLIAIILLTRFNSFYQSFLILSAVVMSGIGVMLGLFLTGQPFSIIMSGIGVVALAGIVVNNNIILIDTWNHIRREKPITTLEASAKAIMRTGVQRLRPVMLTTITTITGLLPMLIGFNLDFINRSLLFGGPSIQWWQPLATTIAFGLTLATFLTLLVTPSALMLAERWRLQRR